MQFHKKANQQFQTLSSIDSEGHHTYKGIYAAGAQDFHLHKLDYLSQHVETTAQADQAQEFDYAGQRESTKQEPPRQQNQESDFSIAHAGGPDDYNDNRRESYGGPGGYQNQGYNDQQ